MRDQQEISADRRFFEALEQRVGGIALEIVGRIDDDRALVAECRAGSEPRLHTAHLRYTDAARDLVWLAVGALAFFLVVLGSVGESQYVGMVLGISGIHTDQFAGGGEGKAALAHAASSGQQPGVVHAFPAQGLAPFAPGSLVAEQHQPAPSPKRVAISARMRLCTSSTLPLPSTTANRSGSARAKARKAALTRAW